MFSEFEGAVMKLKMFCDLNKSSVAKRSLEIILEEHNKLLKEYKELSETIEVGMENK